MNTTLQERYEGAYLGVAVGDSIGCPFETKTDRQIFDIVGDARLKLTAFKDPFSNEFQILPAGFWSDDTAMTRALCDSLTQKDFNPADQFARYKDWLENGQYVPEIPGRPRHSFGVGKRTRTILRDPAGFQPSMLTTEDPAALGTGGLMRTSPIVLRYHGDQEKIWQNARLASAVTHNSRESMDACAAYCLILDRLLAGDSKESALNQLIKSPYYNLINPQIAKIVGTDFSKLKPEDFLPADFQKGKANSFLVQHALSVSLWAWESSHNFEESIDKSVRVGQDTDTYAAITGALAGATYGVKGIPEDWRAGLQSAEELQKDVRKLMAAQNIIV